MASSRISLNNPDWQDTATMLQAFQEINTCSVDLGLQVQAKGSRIELVLIAKAWSHGANRREVKPLASVSVTCSAIGLKSLDAALIHILYMLDGRIAAAELEAAAKKSA